MDSVYSHPHLLLSRYLRPWLIFFNHRLPPICNSVCSTRAPGFAASSRAAKLCLMVSALWIQCTALLRHLAIFLLILSLLFMSKRLGVAAGCCWHGGSAQCSTASTLGYLRCAGASSTAAGPNSACLACLHVFSCRVRRAGVAHARAWHAAFHFVAPRG